MKAAVKAGLAALTSPPATKLEVALLKIVVGAVGVKLGYDFSAWVK